MFDTWVAQSLHNPIGDDGREKLTTDCRRRFHAVWRL